MLWLIIYHVFSSKNSRSMQDVLVRETNIVRVCSVFLTFSPGSGRGVMGGVGRDLAKLCTYRASDPVSR